MRAILVSDSVQVKGLPYREPSYRFHQPGVGTHFLVRFRAVVRNDAGGQTKGFP